MKNTRIAGLMLAIGLCTFAAPAEEPALPLEVQIPMLVKVLTFNRTLSFRSGTALNVGIVYQSGYRASREAEQQALRLFGEKDRDRAQVGFSCLPLPIDIDGRRDLGAAIEERRVDMLFIAPLRGVTPEALARISNQKRILSTTSVPDYVQRGVGVGIGRLAGKPRVLINLASARAAGADFSARLLRMATVIHESAP